MTNEEFKELIQRFNEEELKLQSTKGAEYRRSDDVLANFKRLGDALGIHPALVCMIYLQKHMDSIISFVKGGMDESRLAEPIMGRIQDARNYLLLLAGIFQETKISSMPITFFPSGQYKLNDMNSPSCENCINWDRNDEASANGFCMHKKIKTHFTTVCRNYFSGQCAKDIPENTGPEREIPGPPPGRKEGR